MSALGLLAPLLAAGAAAAALLPAGAAPARPLGSSPSAPSRRVGLTERVGHAVARRLRLAPDPGAARRLGRALVVGLVLAPVVPPAPVVVAAGVVVHALLRARRSARAQGRAVLRSLPDAVDLLLLSTTAGMGLALAHVEVAPRLAGPVGAALRAAAQRSEHGHARADALAAALAPLGERAATLGHILADHLRYGTPLAPELERLGLELRLDRRRAAEEEARRVPVRLLAPLVTCTLPAFALLTVAPLLLASLRHLPT